MGRPPLPADQKRASRVVLKVSEPELALLQSWLAIRSEQSLSAVIRPMIVTAAKRDLEAAGHAIED